MDQKTEEQNKGLKIVDTSGGFLSAFEQDVFSLTKWEAYMDRSVPGAKKMCIEDMKECIGAGFSWEKDFLPVLNEAGRNEMLREKAIRTFLDVTKDLNRKICDRFGKTVNAELILYLGLCNGAGWVTAINGKTVVLFGIEKIMELNWCDIDAMNGLVIHELGHVYQSQYGVLDRTFEKKSDSFLWQLFTEGIAMVFEQEIAADPEYYHQDTDGWKVWCDRNAERIRQSFFTDLPQMSEKNQRYFGDWTDFDGHGDTGYYLGARFVRFLMERDEFDRIIQYEIEDVKAGFDRFMRSSM